MIFNLFSKKWLFSTLFVIAGLFVLVKLGLWQLERLDQRQVFNARVMSQINGSAVDLNNFGLGQDLFDMEYREVSARGYYDRENTIFLTNQVEGVILGVHVLTPLVFIDTGETILVNRGWIPRDLATQEKVAELTPTHEIIVNGVLRRNQVIPQLNMQADPTLTPGEEWRAEWRMVNLDEIEKQIPGLFTYVFIQESPNGDDLEIPIAQEAEITLDDGPHLGYAIQWFVFAIMLLVGYPIFVKNQTQIQ